MVARSLFLSVLLAVTVVQGTRRSSNDVATENLKALEEYKNSMKEQNGQDAKVAAAMDHIYSHAVKLMKEVEDAAKSGGEVTPCGLFKVCYGDTPQCCTVPSGVKGAGTKYCAVKGQRSC
eukprot:CAMPEP_0181483848 /NCGR_PEP_ID=MMETSP1110-20121109/45656_1 /TAXON_ID=174948 /ORGANISM="Symbiodinium sp., Strain CCMP421" /LENGTH=119 /DNA_ID=CAMNT_0023609619 /DNA_START=72 /DNA_END=431 /DNA_ORIENTATION=+